jgi:prophage regulatory protein
MNQEPITAATDAPHGRFLGMKDVVADSGLSKPTINRLHRAGDFPPKRKLSGNRIGWFESDYLAWKHTRARAIDDG